MVDVADPKSNIQIAREDHRLAGFLLELSQVTGEGRIPMSKAIFEPTQLGTRVGDVCSDQHKTSEF